MNNLNLTKKSVSLLSVIGMGIAVVGCANNGSVPDDLNVTAFESVDVSFTHRWNKEVAFPFTGGAAIDIDNDGVVDFEITYKNLSVVSPVDPDPGPHELIVGKLISKNNNQTLNNKTVNSLLFLNDTDLIQTTIVAPLIWEESTDNNSSLLVSISQDIFSKTWAEEWRINNAEIKSSYWIGFKLSDASNSLGYIEVSIDTQTGIVEILNIEFL